MAEAILPPTELECRICPGMSAGVRSERVALCAFVGICGSLFAAATALTVVWCASMSTMRGMPMAGGWTMSMMWMRMPGQTWLESTAWFLVMWVVMMAAMMLPSQAPMLWRYRDAIRWTGESRLGRVTVFASLGYFFVWAVFGLAVFLLGAMLTAVEMEAPLLARAVPATAGVVILMAGAVQFTPWKAHHLARCREIRRHHRSVPTGARIAWQDGMRLGLHCTLSCANWTAILLVIGVMDLNTMALVTAAITIERLAPARTRIAHLTGAALIVAAVVTGVTAFRS